MQGDRAALAGPVQADLVGPHPRVGGEPAECGERVVGPGREQRPAGQDERPIRGLVGRVEPQGERHHARLAKGRDKDVVGPTRAGRPGARPEPAGRVSVPMTGPPAVTKVYVPSPELSAVGDGVPGWKGQPLDGGADPAGPLTRIPVGRREPQQRGAFEQPVHACVLHYGFFTFFVR